MNIITKKDLVVKHNDLIEARYDLNLIEQKLIAYAVSKIDRQKDDFNIVTIKVYDFLELMDSKSMDRHSEFKKVASSLIKNTLHIKKDDGWILTSWLSSAEYIKNQGIIELEFSKKLIPYLLKLKEKFTRYELENIIYMSSKHSIRLYELLKQYQAIGVREFEIDDLRRKMSLENKYKRPYDFENMVIKVALKEINQFSDINIIYDKLLDGRRVHGFRFVIMEKDSNKKIWVDYLKDHCKIGEIKERMGLKDENFNPIQISSIYDVALKMTEGESLDPFMYVNINYLYIREKGNVKNMYSYLIKALNEDYAKASILLRIQRQAEKK